MNHTVAKSWDAPATSRVFAHGGEQQPHKCLPLQLRACCLGATEFAASWTPPFCSARSVFAANSSEHDGRGRVSGHGRRSRIKHHAARIANRGTGCRVAECCDTACVGVVGRAPGLGRAVSSSGHLEWAVGGLSQQRLLSAPASPTRRLGGRVRSRAEHSSAATPLLSFSLSLLSMLSFSQSSLRMRRWDYSRLDGRSPRYSAPSDRRARPLVQASQWRAPSSPLTGGAAIGQRN